METWWNPPISQAINMPGWSEHHFRNMRRYDRMMGVGVLVGTRPNARIGRSWLGGPAVHYTPTVGDLRTLADGMKTLGRILFEAGANRVMANTWGHDEFTHPDERKTALVVGGLWAVAVFVANWLLYRAELMSFLPWVTNFLHTFVWIGGCLTFLYLGLRDREPMLVQCIVFAALSLVVKMAEQQIFGTWEHPHFFHLFEGNAAYVIGWSLADGLYPPITFLGLRLSGRRMPGLQVL